jgi:transposase-like protein
VLCPKCKTDHAHRSHRRGLFELLASLIAIYPYKCRDCNFRFRRFRYAAPEKMPHNDTVREIRATRNALAWKRKRREILLYGTGALLFLVFLYFITRERSGSPDGG